MPAKSPEQQARYNAARKRWKQMLLSFTTEEDARVRSMAALSGRSLSEFVLACVDSLPQPIIDLSDVAKLSAATAALTGVPKAIRDLEADLGRLSGRLSHLFTVAPLQSDKYRDEINETFWAVRDLMRRIEPEITKVQNAVHEPRVEIGIVMRELAFQLKRLNKNPDDLDFHAS